MSALTPLPTLGSTLSSEPLKLVYVRDICRADRPLISLYKSSDGSGSYLEVWADRDDAVERWLVFRLRERDLLSYLHGKRTLRDLVKRAPDGFVFLKDVTQDGETDRLVPLDGLPEDLTPPEGSYYDVTLDPNPGNREEQAILLDGTWSADTLAAVQRGYTQVLAFATCLGHRAVSGLGRLHDRFDHYKFQGGYVRRTALQRFVELLSKPPSTLEIQYASPGILRIGVDPETGDAAKGAIGIFKKDIQRISAQYDDVHGFILKIRRSERKKDKGLSSAEEKMFKRSVEAFAASFKTIDLKALRQVAKTDLAAGELLSSYYRRLKYLHDLEVQQMATFL